MFLSAIQPYVVAIIIVLIVLQYAFALFCLLKLAYFDVSRRDYILWNLFILIGVFVGGIAFLVYYYKHPEKLIPKTPTEKIEDAPTEQAKAEQAETEDAPHKEEEQKSEPEQEGEQE